MPAAETKTARNRPRTEARLREAVGAVLVKGGFAALTPSAVAREAGVDKMLIYRYFGGLPGLVEAVANGPDFFPTFEEVCDGDPAALRALPLSERSAVVVDNYARLLMARPVVLELMVWELVERNELTAIMETAREEMGLRLAREIFAGGGGRAAQINAVSALLGAAVTYLALRRRKIRWFNGVDLRSDEGWAQLREAVRQMTAVLD
ncbi:TetR/AcrR family transcriptional regulator [Phenylobacterium sp.]|uniref:TetR/AcrR family transcriptional regulator n=1 Tax=Phenylobacterium sp. TaxID=1871053 RepID=UPI002735C739|nr:TetR/AcrR family transcriptional regulator [Phenylobacterium sp.]MDP3854329.1 helix-turn-helix domain-containing protein [Phenylobacterium sp.]